MEKLVQNILPFVVHTEYWYLFGHFKVVKNLFKFRLKLFQLFVIFGKIIQVSDTFKSIESNWEYVNWNKFLAIVPGV